MIKKIQNRYTEEYKMKIILAINEKNMSVNKIAKEENINVMTLYRWRNVYDKSILDLGRNDDLKNEILRLKYELKAMTEKCNTLKNAIKILSNEKTN